MTEEYSIYRIQCRYHIHCKLSLNAQFLVTRWGPNGGAFISFKMMSICWSANCYRNHFFGKELQEMESSGVGLHLLIGLAQWFGFYLFVPLVWLDKNFKWLTLKFSVSGDQQMSKKSSKSSRNWYKISASLF